MIRAWHVGVAFALFLAAVTFALWSLAGAAVDLAAEQAGAAARAETESEVRLALWRMDSAIAPMIAQESARPYFAFGAFHPAERAYNDMFEEIGHGEVLVPSPLLARPGEHVRLYFQVDPEGRVTSPQVPEGRMRRIAVSQYVRDEDVAEAERRLEEFKHIARREALFAALPPAVASPSAALRPWVPPELAADAKIVSGAEFARNASEFSQRVQNFDNAQNANRAPAIASGAAVREGAYQPFWIGGELVLARRIEIDGKSFAQGCWLDWRALAARMLAAVEDLVAGARLEPIDGAARANPGRALAALPLQLVELEPDVARAGLSDELRFSLGIGVGSALLSALAVAALLFGLMRLAERRAAFVSAVTHELRTPLTTFRLYTDLLADGRVPDQAKQQRYLTTLQGEAERLHHLIENVLAYSRIERAPEQRKREAFEVAALVERVRERLAERVARGGMELVVERAAGVTAPTAEGDGDAIERILVNLVDNACKYAAGAADRRIHLELDGARDRVVLRVRDHGPGVAADVRRRLFRPFSKSVGEAAKSAPGVGLGLALSRRLARAQGGTLEHRPADGGGAVFELRLRAG